MAEQESDPERLAAAAAAMARTRELTRRGRGQMACVLEHAGIGDWRHVPRPIRAVALVSRLCEDAPTLTAFRRLVLLAEARAGRLLQRPCARGQPGYLLPLRRLAARHRDWLGPPESWRPLGTTAPAQFAHLARWLLGPSEARRSLETLAPPSESDCLHEWLALTMPLTRRMAHCFHAAPGHYDPIRALRWGQVMALGGDPALARVVAHSPLGSQLWPPPEEVWWRSVIHWFVNHPAEATDVTPIIEHACACRYGDVACQKPPDPAFSMKGRAYRALLERMDQWAREAAARDTQPYREFAPCGARPGQWEIVEGAGRCVWTITEILDGAALREEALRMHHCVDRYAKWIRKGRCSIWSMRVSRGGITRRAATIDLHYSEREIFECRGRGNRPARPEELAILRRWAAENGIKVRDG